MKQCLVCVELYKLVTFNFCLYRVIDSTSEASYTDLLDPPADVLKDEINKAFNQVVVNADSVIVVDEEINYEFYKNGIFDILPVGITRGPEYDSIWGREQDEWSQYDEDTRSAAMVKKIRENWKLKEDAEKGVDSIKTPTYMIVGDPFGIGSSANEYYEDEDTVITGYETFKVTEIYKIYIDGDSVEYARFEPPLKQDFDAGEPIWKETLGGLALTPTLVLASPQIFHIVAHETLHNLGTPKLFDLLEEDNIMCWHTYSGAIRKMLRFRKQTVGRYGVQQNEMMQNQWNAINRY